MLNDNEIMAQSANTAFNYLQQLGPLSTQQQLQFLQQPQLLVETKSPDLLLDQFYQSNEFQCKFNFNFQSTNRYLKKEF